MFEVIYEGGHQLELMCDGFTIYTNNKVYYIPKTNIRLYINCISIFKNE